MDTQSSTHPPLPPTTEDDRIARLRLLRSRRVGCLTYHRLMKEHGSAAAALDALPGVARAAGEQTYRPCTDSEARRECAAGRKSGARLVFAGEPGYPPLLSHLRDAPPMLWVAGNAEIATRPCLAIVGARNASSLGLRTARRLAEALGQEGFTIVSGLARGIDGAAHTAALPTGTIAVMAGGLDVIYPSEHRSLAQDIARDGLLLSEQPIGVPPQARHFPVRNRLVSGMSLAVIVVEAAAKSGSLITARTALDQGRDVMAVPGHPFDARAGGCNLLIRDGATLIRDSRDVIEALTPPDTGPVIAPVRSVAPAAASMITAAPCVSVAGLADAILSRLGPSPIPEDQLIRDLCADARDIAATLTDLELSGQIDRHPGGLIARIGHRA